MQKMCSNKPMFRAMKEDREGRPILGRSAYALGVRVEGDRRDIELIDGRTVQPGTGGMSVSLDSYKNLHKYRLPRALGGDGRHPAFVMQSDNLPHSLSLRIDQYPHALVEPSVPADFEEYERALHGTRRYWRRIHE
jgi:hypothetical protein